MKIHCPISGVSYEVSFPAAGHATAPHPMLSLPVKELNETFLPTWAAGSMSSELQHLLALSYLCKLPVTAIHAFGRTSHAELTTFWGKNMEAVARLATSLENRATKGLPTLTLSADTIGCLSGWIEALTTAQACRSMPTSDLARKLNSQNWKAEVSILVGGKVNSGADQKEIDSLILRGLRGSPLSRSESGKYPTYITNWIANAAPFPTAKVELPSGKKVTLSEHWRHILEIAFSKDGALDLLCEDVNAGDLEEILEHCYNELPADGLMSSLVWKKLEAVRDVLEEFKTSTRPVKPEKVALYSGTDSDLAALLGEETPVSKPTQDTGLTLLQKLAAKIKK